MADCNFDLSYKVLVARFQNATVYCGILDDAGSEADMKPADPNFDHEIDGNGDTTRPQITFGEPAIVSDKMTTKNSNSVEFTSMPAVTVKYAFVSDSETVGEGEILAKLICPSTQAFNAGDTCRFAIGVLAVDLD